MKVFEDRSTYVRGADDVATLTLTVECSPGQVANLSNFLVGVTSKAGVYSVEMDHTVSVVQGEVNGEQPLQHADHDDQASELGTGEETTVTGESGLVDAGTDGELAGSSGEVGTESVSGSTAGKGVRQGGRAGRR